MADPDTNNNPGQPTSISGTIRHTLHSTEIDETFVIDVALPLALQETQGQAPLPVIYLTDGNMMFPMVTSTLRLLQAGNEAPAAILVGIGYANEADVLKLRTRDLTPTHNAAYDAAELSNAPKGVRSGGADAFLDFISKEVKPLIHANYPAAKTGDTLMGDSLGGLFALYAMLTRTEEYTNYVAGSPVSVVGQQNTAAA